MLKKTYPFYLANQPVRPNADLEVVDKYTGRVATRVAMADENAIDETIRMTVEATGPIREMPAYKRGEVL